MGVVSDRPRVAIVAASLDILGGHGVQVLSLMQGLSGDGHPVTFLPVNPSFPLGLRWLRRIRFLRTLANEALYIPGLLRLAAADVAHVFSASYTSFLLAPVPAMVAARLLNTRVVLHYHSGEADDHLATWGALVHPFLRLADTIVVPSRYLAEVFQRHGYDTRVIPNVVDLTRFAFRPRQPLRPRLLSTRNLEPHYRVDVVLDAFARVKAEHPEATLTIAGYGSEETRLRQMAGAGVRFVGRVEPHDMPRLCSEADIFLNASVVDNQPVSILEAFAAGLSVVSTPTGDIPAMVRHCETGLLVPPGDARAMAEAVCTLLDGRADAAAMSRTAREGLARYTWPSVSREWTVVYGARRRSRRGLAARIRRLATMTPAEIAGRGRQALSVRLERARLTTPAADAVESIRRHAPALVDPEAARGWFHGLPQRLVPSAAAAETLSLLHSRHPEQVRSITDESERLLAGDFDLLGYTGLRFGQPLDWRLDPVHRRRSPLVHWSRLDPLDSHVTGDSKIVWELNRHQWLVRLAQASALTGDPRGWQAAVRIVDEWLDANPPGMGINWASSLEVSYRLIAWCWTLSLLTSVADVPAAWLQRVYAALWTHANHISRYLSHHFSPNTHLTGEALGLVYAGSVLRESRNAARWRAEGAQILESECRRQVLPDGVYFEQAACYHQYTVEIYLHYLVLAARAGLSPSPELRDKVRGMVEWLIWLQGPDRRLPAIGDEDGGRVLPLAVREPRDARGLLAIAATIFERPHFAWAANGLQPEVAWMLGPTGVSSFDGIAAAPPEPSPSRLFADGGYAVMRSDWGPEAHQAIVDVGPLGCPVSGAHGHADLLTLQCAAFGTPCLVDPGTFTYTGDAQWRDAFRGASLHSGVVVDGRPYAEPAGPFQWRHRPRARLRAWRSDARIDFVDADHEATPRGPDTVVHRRRVWFIKPDCWIIVDDLTGTADHHVALTFQFAPIVVTLAEPPWVRAQMPGGRVVWLGALSAQPLDITLRVGETDPIAGWISPSYGQRTPAPQLTYALDTALPWRVVTVILPDAAGSTTPPHAAAILNDDAVISGVAFEPPRRAFHLPIDPSRDHLST